MLWDHVSLGLWAVLTCRVLTKSDEAASTVSDWTTVILRCSERTLEKSCAVQMSVRKGEGYAIGHSVALT